MVRKVYRRFKPFKHLQAASIGIQSKLLFYAIYSVERAALNLHSNVETSFLINGQLTGAY